jgi:hypothetical protein
MCHAPTSEQELLAEMDSWTPLPDEVDRLWDGDEPWQDFERLLAAADASGTHQWQDVAIRVFEFAADWDLHGAMQGIRHGPERAFSYANGDQELANRLEPLTEHARPGTRYWVARELGILRQLSSLPHLVALTGDPRPDVAECALDSIAMLGQHHEFAKAQAARLGWRPA